MTSSVLHLALQHCFKRQNEKFHHSSAVNSELEGKSFTFDFRLEFILAEDVFEGRRIQLRTMTTFRLFFLCLIFRGSEDGVIFRSRGSEGGEGFQG